jgi:hypothetical protein
MLLFIVVRSRSDPQRLLAALSQQCFRHPLLPAPPCSAPLVELPPVPRTVGVGAVVEEMAGEVEEGERVVGEDEGE